MMEEHQFIFFWALSISCIALLVAWTQGLFHRFSSSPYPHIRGIDVLRGFGYFLGLEIFVAPFLFRLFFLAFGKPWDEGVLSDPFTRGWIHLWIILGGFIGAICTYSQLGPLERRQIWKQTDTPWLSHIGIGIAMWFVSYPVVLAFSEGISILYWYVFDETVTEQTVVQNVRQLLEYPFLFGMTALSIVAIVPLTEEFLFRGLMQSWLKDKTKNTSFAIVVTSCVFACFHYSSDQGLANLVVLTTLFLLSCALGYLYERQRSLWAPVGLHSFFNFMSVLMLIGEGK